MKKIPRSDPRADYIAADQELSAAELAAHLEGRHQWILATTRADGRPQMSAVTGARLDDGRLAVATYPNRAKTRNVRRNPHVSVLVLGDAFNDPWIQIDGEAEVLDVPEAVAALVDYFRAIRGGHDDWDEYRRAMIDQGKSVILVTPTRWSPLSRGGFPPELFED